VESGGVGAGTITRFKVTAGGRTREYRMRVDEPEPGRVVTESDTGSSLVTTTTVSPRDGASLVQISTTWDGAGGIGGVFERMFAPRVMRAIYADELERLNTYAHEQRPDKPDGEPEPSTGYLNNDALPEHRRPSVHVPYSRSGAEEPWPTVAGSAQLAGPGGCGPVFLAERRGSAGVLAFADLGDEVPDGGEGEVRAVAEDGVTRSRKSHEAGGVGWQLAG
jgi:Polyketide cyclase / dehydrase and lipid transport